MIENFNEKSIDKSLSKNWTATFFLDNEKSMNDLETLKQHELFQYLCYGVEKCPKTNKIHFQAFFQINKQQRFSYIKKNILKNTHFEIMKGSIDQNFKYCSKDANVYEFGELSYQGKRNDTKNSKSNKKEILENIKSGISIPDLIEQNPSLIFKIKDLKILETTINTKVRNWKMNILVYWGVSGSGKTYKAKSYDELENIYVLQPPSNNGILWWDGYDNKKHKTIIIDEMNGSFMTFTDFKLLCDNSPYKVQYKGGKTEFLAETIIFTSNYHLLSWYNFKNDIDLMAFKRRINKVEYFEKTRFEDINEWNDNTPYHILNEIFNKDDNKEKYI